jgi:hypothetical protein
MRCSYYRARYYDTSIGRFLSEDPLQFGGEGVDFYGFVGNSPTGFTDAFGLSKDGAKAGLCEISKTKFSGPCRKFLELLANLHGISIDGLISQLQATASDAQNYVYDGPSSNEPLDHSKFPGADGSTIGQWFSAHNGAGALSQANGSAIFLSGAWEGGSSSLFDPLMTWGGNPTAYGLGMLLHELLHKQSVAGGFSHQQMEDALDAVKAPLRNLGRDDISDRIGKICFGRRK